MQTPIRQILPKRLKPVSDYFLLAILAGWIVIETYQQMVAGTGSADIGQADAFGDGMTVFRFQRGRIIRRLYAWHPSAIAGAFGLHLRLAGRGIEQHFRVTASSPVSRVAVQPQQDDDGKLQPLGPVHRHYPHGVIVRFGHGNLGNAGILLLPAFRPAQKPPQGKRRHPGRNGAVVLQIARLLHQKLPPPPNFPMAILRQVQLIQPPVANEPGNQPRHGISPALPVIFPQLLHPVPYRRRRLLKCPLLSVIVQKAGLVVPDGGFAPRLPPAQQLGIRAGKSRRPQGGHHRHLIRRVVNGAQAVQQILHLLRSEKQRRPLQPIGNVGILQPARQNAQPVAAADEDADIAQVGGANDLVALVIHLKAGSPGAIAGIGNNQTGDVFRLRPPHFVGLVIQWATKHLHRAKAILLYVLVGQQRLILRLYASILPHQPLPIILPLAAEHSIDPIQRRLLGTAVLGDTQRLQPPAVLNLLNNGNISIAEAVDGLLGVADNKQLARLQRQGVPGLVGNIGIGGGGQVEGDFGLQGVGVLELVNQDMGVLPLEMRPRLAIIPQEVARPDQHIVKGSDAFGFALRLVGHGKVLAESRS